MADEPDLFAPRAPTPEPPKALARASDPDTSHAAAAALSERRLTHLQQVVLDAVTRAEPHGLTTVEMAEATGLSRVTVSPRVKPMCAMKLLMNSGERRQREGYRAGIVWKLYKEPDL